MTDLLPCPRPFNDGPQDLTAAECVSKGQCGCGAVAQTVRDRGDIVRRLRSLDDGVSRPVSIMEREVCGQAAAALEGQYKPFSEQEMHAIGHARFQVERATPEFPELCFDYELVLTLLRIIDRRSSVVPSTQSGSGK